MSHPKHVRSAPSICIPSPLHIHCKFPASKVHSGGAPSQRFSQSLNFAALQALQFTGMFQMGSTSKHFAKPIKIHGELQQRIFFQPAVERGERMAWALTIAHFCKSLDDQFHLLWFQVGLPSGNTWNDASNWSTPSGVSSVCVFMDLRAIAIDPFIHKIHL